MFQYDDVFQTTFQKESEFKEIKSCWTKNNGGF